MSEPRPCVRCGRCCREAKRCSFLRWFRADHSMTIDGQCEMLIDNGDGTTACKVIVEAFTPTREWDERGRKWITEVFVGRGCELDLEPAQQENAGEEQPPSGREGT